MPESSIPLSVVQKTVKKTKKQQQPENQYVDDPNWKKKMRSKFTKT